MLNYNSINSNDKNNKYLLKSYNSYPDSYDYINYFFFNRKKKVSFNSKNNYKNLPNFVDNYQRLESKLKIYMGILVEFIFSLIKYKNIDKHFFLKYRKFELMKLINYNKKKKELIKRWMKSKKKKNKNVFKNKNILKIKIQTENFTNKKINNLIYYKVNFLKKMLFKYLNTLNNENFSNYVKVYYNKFNKVLNLLFKKKNKNIFMINNYDNNYTNLNLIYYNNFSNIFYNYNKFSIKLKKKIRKIFKKKTRKYSKKRSKKLLKGKFEKNFSSKFKRKKIINKFTKKNFLSKRSYLIDKAYWRRIDFYEKKNKRKRFFYKKRGLGFATKRLRIKKLYKKFKFIFWKRRRVMWSKFWEKMPTFRKIRLSKFVKKVIHGILNNKLNDMFKWIENKTYNDVVNIMTAIAYNVIRKRKKKRKFRNRKVKKRRYRRYKRRVNRILLKNQLLYKEKNNIKNFQIDYSKSILKKNVNYFNNDKLKIINKDIILNFFNYHNNEHLLKNYLKDNYFKLNNYFLYLIIKKIFNSKSKNNLLKYFYIYLYNKHRNNNIFFENKLIINKLLYKKQLKHKLADKLNSIKNIIKNYICNLILIENKIFVFLDLNLHNNINNFFQFKLFVLILLNNIKINNKKIKKFKMYYIK